MVSWQPWSPEARQREPVRRRASLTVAMEDVDGALAQDPGSSPQFSWSPASTMITLKNRRFMARHMM